MLASALSISVLLVLTLTLVAAMTRQYDDCLTGVWVCDPAFLESAQLGDFQFYIAPGTRERTGYLIIANEDGTLAANQAVTVKTGHYLARAAATVHALAKGVQRGHMEILGAETMMPQHLQWSLSLKGESLTLHDQKTIYAFMYKDVVASAAAQTAWDAQPIKD